MTQSRGIFIIQAPHFAQMLIRDYSFKKSTRTTQKFKMATIFFKMADMSGKEIIKFAKNMPSCPIGMIMVSNHIVLEHVENEFGHLELPGSFFRLQSQP